MRIVGLILFMLMLANTLDDVVDDKEVQIHEEKFEDTDIQRKLEGKTNYVTLILNQDYSFAIEKKNIIEKIIINNGEPENLEKKIKVTKDTEIQIYFNTTLSDCSKFFVDINNGIKNKIVSIDLSKFDSSNLEKISSMFSGCSSLKSINFLNFNTSKVKSLYFLFYGCSSLEEVDLSNLDTSMVTNMEYLFYGCSSLEKVNLSKLNTSLVTTMDRLFYGCSALEKVDLSKFNTSNLISMNYLFEGVHH